MKTLPIGNKTLQSGSKNLGSKNLESKSLESKKLENKNPQSKSLESKTRNTKPCNPPPNQIATSSHRPPTRSIVERNPAALRKANASARPSFTRSG